MKYEKGFTLFISIMATSLILLIAFVLTNVALKQLQFSYASQESQYSFYNADNGIECAFYWDTKNGAVSAFDATAPSGTITCNGQTIIAGQSVPTVPATTSAIGGGAGLPFTSIFKVDFPKGCAIVTVIKDISGGTTISSKGYNTCNTSALRRFERGVLLIY